MVSLLSLLPLFLSIPFDTDLEVYKRLALFEFKNELEFALVAPALGAIVGCWLGAIAIPLDWDRDWQVCLLSSSTPCFPRFRLSFLSLDDPDLFFLPTCQ